MYLSVLCKYSINILIYEIIITQLNNCALHISCYTTNVEHRFIQLHLLWFCLGAHVVSNSSVPRIALAFHLRCSLLLFFCSAPSSAFLTRFEKGGEYLEETTTTVWAEEAWSEWAVGFTWSDWALFLFWFVFFHQVLLWSRSEPAPEF